IGQGAESAGVVRRVRGRIIKAQVGFWALSFGASKRGGQNQRLIVRGWVGIRAGLIVGQDLVRRQHVVVVEGDFINVPFEFFSSTRSQVIGTDGKIRRRPAVLGRIGVCRISGGSVRGYCETVKIRCQDTLPRYSAVDSRTNIGLWFPGNYQLLPF